tara:strand:- start:448 stop:609 length:162 start_codon:yes stop_codon:yes gene_type:complete
MTDDDAANASMDGVWASGSRVPGKAFEKADERHASPMTRRRDGASATTMLLKR